MHPVKDCVGAYSVTGIVHGAGHTAEQKTGNTPSPRLSSSHSIWTLTYTWFLLFLFSAVF